MLVPSAVNFGTKLFIPPYIKQIPKDKQYTCRYVISTCIRTKHCLRSLSNMSMLKNWFALPVGTQVLLRRHPLKPGSTCPLSVFRMSFSRFNHQQGSSRAHAYCILQSQNTKSRMELSLVRIMAQVCKNNHKCIVQLFYTEARWHCRQKGRQTPEK